MLTVEVLRRRGDGLAWRPAYVGTGPLVCETKQEAAKAIRRLLANGAGTVRAVRDGRVGLIGCVDAAGRATIFGPHGLMHSDLPDSASAGAADDETPAGQTGCADTQSRRPAR